MPTNSTGLLERPQQFHRSPIERGGHIASPTRTSGGTPQRTLAGLDETDFYLRRSYAIVERLRRAVASHDSRDLTALLR